MPISLSMTPSLLVLAVLPASFENLLSTLKYQKALIPSFFFLFHFYIWIFQHLTNLARKENPVLQPLAEVGLSAVPWPVRAESLPAVGEVRG